MLTFQLSLLLTNTFLLYCFQLFLFCFGFFLLYNRGIPATSSTSIDEMQVNRDVAKKPVFIAAGLTILFGAIGGTISQLLPLSFLLEEATVAVGVVLGFFTSATFFKVQDEY